MSRISGSPSDETAIKASVASALDAVRVVEEFLLMELQGSPALHLLDVQDLPHVDDLVQQVAESLSGKE